MRIIFLEREKHSVLLTDDAKMVVICTLIGMSEKRGNLFQNMWTM